MKQWLATHIPKWWQHRSLGMACLLPLSGLYALISGAQRWLYQHQIKRVYRSPVPVMVIGNITVGGSGKTPLIIALVHTLQQAGVRVGVISRGYGGEGPFPACVTPQSSPNVVGDEPVLITMRTQVPMVVAPKRQAAIELLIAQNPDIQLILSDDGLQHLAMARDLEWVVVDGQRGLGNGWLLPAGPLRESAKRLSHVTVIEHSPDPKTPYHMHLQPATLYGMHTANASPPQAGQQVHAIAGIGHPQRFFDSLRILGFDVLEHAFADHHAYIVEDVQFFDGLPIITTEKDAVKLVSLHVPMWVLPVDAQLSNDCYRLLEQQLEQIGLQCHVSRSLSPHI